MKSLLRLVLVALGLLLAPQAADAANRFLVACATACTWDNSSTLIWSTTSGGSAGAAAPTSADAVTLDANSCVGGVTCTITVNANISVSLLTMSACTASTTGCILDFSANNNNVTIGGTLTNNGSGTRTLNCGTGTWKFTQAGSSIWSVFGATNLTENCSGANILIQPSAPPTSIISFSPLASKTYGSLSIVGSTSPGLAVWLVPTTALTFGSCSLAGPLTLIINPSTTLTCTSAVSWTGSATSPILLEASSVTGGLRFTLNTPNTSTMSFMGFYGVILTNAITATSSFDFGNNSGFTAITPPSVGGGGHIIGG